MKRLLLLWIGLVAPLRAYESKAEIERLYAATQQAIDQALASADRIVVEAVESRTTRRFVWASEESVDVRAVVGAIKLRPPKIKAYVEEGKEQYTVVVGRCACYGQLWITLKRGDQVLLLCLVKHGSQIWSESLPVEWVLEIEPKPLAPFYERMMALVKRSEANQTPEPTPPAGTSAAEQPLVPAAVVAHL